MQLFALNAASNRKGKLCGPCL